MKMFRSLDFYNYFFAKLLLANIHFRHPQEQEIDQNIMQVQCISLYISNIKTSVSHVLSPSPLCTMKANLVLYFCGEVLHLSNCQTSLPTFMLVCGHILKTVRSCRGVLFAVPADRRKKALGLFSLVSLVVFVLCLSHRVPLGTFINLFPADISSIFMIIILYTEMM